MNEIDGKVRNIAHYTVKGNVLFTPVGGCYIKRQKQQKVDIRNLPTDVNGEGNISPTIDKLNVLYPIILYISM